MVRPAPSRPEIHLISLGGTISMAADQGGVAPRLGADALLRAVPALAETDVDLKVSDFRPAPVPGASLTVDDIAELAELIKQREQASATGFVIVQGTDTIEETAFLLDLLHTGSAPAIVTGAMRHPALPGADGPANIFAAVQTACAPAAHGAGILVVFSDQIHAARFVRKVHASAPSAFASPTTGPLGLITEGRPQFLLRPPDRLTVPGPLIRRAKVALVTATLGDDGEHLHGLADRYDGATIAAFGVGHVPSSWVEALEAAARRIPVVYASRTGAGSTASGTYAFAGSETDLLKRGLIPAGPLDPYKARLLLLALLRTGADRAAVEVAFIGQREF
ncbi:asparaginase [Streptomyces chrestomyceticus]|uniref:asparaginase n=1 Tax=Streptomyces chrestomyceticus TaxID=68185 RepID=UPI0033F544ED